MVYRLFDWNYLVGVHIPGINGHPAANQNQVWRAVKQLRNYG